MQQRAGLPVATSPTSANWAEREAAVARVAAVQHDQITTAQLLAAGFSSSAIADRLRTGRLHHVHRGVYSLGRPPKTGDERRMAAVLAGGEGFCLSFAAAGAQLDLRESAATRIDVSGPTRRRHRRGIRFHLARTLEPVDIVLVENIPTTSCARTLLDLASMLSPDALATAFDRAEIVRILDMNAIKDVIERNPGHHGLRPLRALLSSLDPQRKHTRNDFERRLLALLREAGLPVPEVNADLWLEDRDVQPDFLWRKERLVLEADGWETHGTRQAFERDRAKDALLIRHGYRVIRVTWRQVENEPKQLITTITAALAGPIAPRGALGGWR